ncbi:uncharacterized protein LOC112127803 [Cimex lectularius]|uniref:Uncharacterized protein n=1 Tax=Cimex lectularius TaxID=79782 RepID=A0A8I6SNZ5_CIMLE|nr:uncharacterized protein LOC112127803 [Cimex lectularius]
MTGKSVKQTVNSQAARLTPVSQDPRVTPGSQDRGPGEKQPYSVWDSTRGLSQPEPARTSRCDHRAKSEVERRDAVNTDRGEHRLGRTRPGSLVNGTVQLCGALSSTICKGLDHRKSLSKRRRPRYPDR